MRLQKTAVIALRWISTCLNRLSRTVEQAKHASMGRIFPITRCTALPLHIILATWLGILFVMATTTTTAQTLHKVIDEQGNATSTDTPPPGAIGAEQAINATNTTPAPQNSGVITSTNTEAARAENGRPLETRITAPADQAKIPMGPGNFVVEVAVSPALGTGENLVLTLDGSLAGAPQRDARSQLTNIFRGVHRLQVLRLDANGTQQDASREQMLSVISPSLRN